MGCRALPLALGARTSVGVTDGNLVRPYGTERSRKRLNAVNLCLTRNPVRMLWARQARSGETSRPAARSLVSRIRTWTLCRQFDVDARLRDSRTLLASFCSTPLSPFVVCRPSHGDFVELLHVVVMSYVRRSGDVDVPSPSELGSVGPAVSGQASDKVHAPPAHGG